MFGGFFGGFVFSFPGTLSAYGLKAFMIVGAIVGAYQCRRRAVISGLAQTTKLLFALAFLTGALLMLVANLLVNWT